jgi:transposase-like protein
MGRKGYPAEFRRRTLDLVAADKPVREVARLLEVSDESIYSGRRQELIDRGELPGLTSEEREELREARRRIRELETELAVHRRAAELLKESVRPKAFRGDRDDGWRGVAGRGRLSCARGLVRRVLRLAVAARAVRHAWLTDLIQEIHAASYGAYGANRVHAELVLGRGLRVGHCSVAVLMQRPGQLAS